MTYEVELKFRAHDPATLDERLSRFGIQWDNVEFHRDCYLSHPERDFAQTDEAFRLRTIDDQHWLTYKGPRIDKATKTRKEIEISVGQGEDHGDRMLEMLAALGFQPKGIVTKRRRNGHLLFKDERVTVARDEVDQLGAFIELEMIADESQLTLRREMILSLAELLELGVHEPRGYVQLLAAQNK